MVLVVISAALMESAAFLLFFFLAMAEGCRLVLVYLVRREKQDVNEFASPNLGLGSVGLVEIDVVSARIEVKLW